MVLHTGLTAYPLEGFILTDGTVGTLKRVLLKSRAPNSSYPSGVHGAQVPTRDMGFGATWEAFDVRIARRAYGAKPGLAAVARQRDKAYPG